MTGTVFHLAEGDTASGERTLRNVANLLADETIDASVTIVANGGGVGHLRGRAPTAERLRALLGEGVEVCACSNTIERAEYDAGDLVDGVRVVSSGMAELIRRQAADDAYVRP